MGSPHPDLLHGGDDDDTICTRDGDATTEVAFGGEGSDTIYYHPDVNTDKLTMYGGPGFDTCNTSSSSANCESHASDVPFECASHGVGTALFFYQDVDALPAPNGTGPKANSVKSGLTTDGITIKSDAPRWVTWVAKDYTSGLQLEDPNFTRLSDGGYRMAARYGGDHAYDRQFAYHRRDATPLVNESFIVTIAPRLEL